MQILGRHDSLWSKSPDECRCRRPLEAFGEKSSPVGRRTLPPFSSTDSRSTWGCSNLVEMLGPMACAVCRKSIGEHETFALLEGVPYHYECFDRCLRSQELGCAGEPPPEE